MVVFLGKKPDNLDQIDNGIESDNDSIVSSSSTVFSDENDRNAAQGRYSANLLGISLTVSWRCCVSE